MCSALGIELGGTKVSVVNFPDGIEGNHAVIKLPSGGNLLSLGTASFTSLLRAIINDLKITNPADVDVAAGISGVDTKQQLADVQKCFQNLGFTYNRLHIVNDAALMLEALGRNGIIVVAGTGSVCIGRHDGRQGRAGGHDYLIGDEGSGFYIAKRAINEVLLLAEKQRTTPTLLQEALLSHYKLNTCAEIDNLIYPSDGSVAKSVVASFAPRVFELAGQGDFVAREIIVQAAQDISNLILGVMRQLEVQEAHVGLRGGIFQAHECDDLLLASISSTLKNNAMKVSLLNLEREIDGVDPVVLACRNMLLKAD